MKSAAPEDVRVGRPEAVRIERGARTGQMIIISIDSTRLGPALGGCRIKSYSTWQDGLTDALRLSRAMTEKAALAGLAHGGGKTVVALEQSGTAEFTGPRRADLLADVADLVQGFGGDYLVGPDVGTGPADMSEIGRRTAHVLCRPESDGGSGDSSIPTALGVLASIEAVRHVVLKDRPVASIRIAVVGLGRVGRLVGQELAAAGAPLVIADVDQSRAALAHDWGATWVDPVSALAEDVDIVVPAAVGGILTPTSVAGLRCQAVVGPANNQLDADSTADLLHSRNITWVPDTVVSAGGMVSTVARELHHLSAAEADNQVRGIGRRVGELLTAAASHRTTPSQEARRRAAELLGEPHLAPA